MFTNLGIEQLRRAARDGLKSTQVLEARHTTDDLLSALVQQVGQPRGILIIDRRKP